MTDTQQRLDRNLKNLLGEHTPLIKVYKYEEVLDMLIAARSTNKSSIEFNGSIEPLAFSRFQTAKFRVETFENAQKNVVTIISW